MRNFRHLVFVIGATVGVFSLAGAATAPPPDAVLVPGSWQHHDIKISYSGITTRFSCSGLENRVKDILVHFGARKDAKVDASGCLGPDRPSRILWVNADFYTLAPAADAAAPDTVKAYWTPREIQPNRPFFMDDGDCELVDQMKDALSKNFALKDLKYDTDCVPYQLNLNGYHVKADALIAAPAPKSDTKRS